MSNYINKARRRLGRNGKDVGEVYSNNTSAFMESNFHIATTFNVLEVKSNELPDLNQIDSRVIEIERMGSLRELLFRPYQGLVIGAYVGFDEDTWLVIDSWGNKTMTQKAMMQRCNNRINWLNKDGDMNTYMCIASQSPLGSKSNQGKLEIEWNKYDVSLPLGQLYVFMERNKDTSAITLNHRFIFGNNVYEVTGIDDTSMTNPDGYGIIQLTTKVTTRQDGDDFINGIAFNKYEDVEELNSPFTKILAKEEDEDKGGMIW